MRNQVMRQGLTVVVGAAVLGVCGMARPDHLTLLSTRGTDFQVSVSSVQATMSYSAESAATGSLILTVSNATTGVSPAGAVTAFALNMPPGVVASFVPSELNDDDGPWSPAHPTTTPASIGSFNTIITVDGAHFMGAGNGSNGLEGADETGQGGETCTFVFNITAASGFEATSLSTLDFVRANGEGYGAAFKVKGIGSEGLSEPNLAQGIEPDDSTTAGSVGASGDAWWLVTASINGTLLADTCGSASDPVLSIHMDDPGSPALNAESGCATSEAACETAPCLSVAVAEGETYLVHAAVEDGASTPILLDVDIVQTPCPWDLEADNSVNIADLLVVFGAWGSSLGHPADFDADGAVGITDLLALLQNWGECP